MQTGTTIGRFTHTMLAFIEVDHMSKVRFGSLNTASSFWKAYREGVREGKYGMPEQDQSDGNGCYLAQLEEQARVVGGKVNRCWTREKDSLLQKIDKSWELYIERRNDVHSLLERHEDRIFESRLCVGSFVHWLLMCLLAIGEIPMNMVVFRLFGENDLFNLLCAIVLALMLPISACVIGVLLKRFQRSKKDIATISGCLLLVLSVLPVLGLIRDHYLIAKGMSTDRLITISFIIIQYLIFWGALVLSYAHASPLNRHKMQHARDRWIHNSIALQKTEKSRSWEVNYWRNGVDRIKDVYVASNLVNRPEKMPVPLVFYLEDYDDSINNPI